MGSMAIPGTFKYTKQDGLYQLRCGNAILADMDRVAVVFSLLPDGTTIRRKTGTYDSALDWFRWAKAGYEGVGVPEMADELCFLISDQWDLDDLNKIMDDGGYIAVFLQKRNINPDDLKYLGESSRSIDVLSTDDAVDD